MKTAPRFRLSPLALAVGAVLAGGLHTAPSQAATFIVTTTQDVVDASDGATSFREAVELANVNDGLDVIEFDPALNGQVIEVDAATNGNAITVAGDTEIRGPGSGQLTIAPVVTATNHAGAFNVSGGDVTVSGLTLDGRGSLARFAITDIGAGADDSLTIDDVVVERYTNNGLYWRAGQLTVTNSVFRDNDLTAGASPLYVEAEQIEIRDSRFEDNSNSSAGGAITVQAESSALIADSVISGNSAEDGGGLLIRPGRGSITIEGSTIEDNVGRFGGGGILFDPRDTTIEPSFTSTLRIIDSTIARNITTETSFGSSQEVGSGAGLFVDGTTQLGYRLEIRQSTFSGNIAAAVGGAIYVGERTADADVDIDFTTITDNTAAYSGALLAANAGGADIDVSNSVLAGNTGTQDGRDLGNAVGMTLTTGDTINVAYSYVGAADEHVVDAGGSTSTVNGGDPQLGPLGLAPYGSQETAVHIPLEGSPLIDAGDPSRMAGTGNTPTLDQAGAERVVDAEIDIGSVEVQPADSGNGDSDDGDSGNGDSGSGDSDDDSGGGGGGGGALGTGLLGLLAGLLGLRRRTR
jgi:hypothetical protein